MTSPSAGPAFPAASHDHSHCVADALAQAEAVCRERGLKLTKQRRRVLEIVWDSHKPVGAYDILDSLGEGGKRPAPPTVYRALDFLIDAGLVHRLDSLNAFIGCADPSHAHAGQFLICSSCRSVAEIDDTAVKNVVDERARDAGFEPESLVLEVQGTCASCRAG
ncbi:MAG: Fur family transcriptional regulator [Pseudomonadota bacterium]